MDVADVDGDITCLTCEFLPSYQEQLITNGYMGMGQAIWFLCRDEHIHDHLFWCSPNYKDLDFWPWVLFGGSNFLVNFKWCLGLGILDRIPPFKTFLSKWSKNQSSWEQRHAAGMKDTDDADCFGFRRGQKTIRLKIIGPPQVEWTWMN